MAARAKDQPYVITEFLKQGIDAVASARAAALLDPEGESLANSLAAIDAQVALPVAAE